MLNRQEYMQNISSRLTALANHVDSQNELGLFDVNKHSEIFYQKLLNLVYGRNFIQLNSRVKKNYPAIDLGDKGAGEAIQITSSNTRDKVKETLRKFHDHKLYEEYRELKIVVITQKKEFKRDFESPELHFNQADHIIDVTDILETISSMDAVQMEIVNAFLEAEIKSPDLRSRIECNEVETIMAVVDHLSGDDLALNNEYEEKDPDPRGKIERRFKDHTSYLTKEFQSLMSIYEDMHKEALTSCGIDAIKSKKMALFLRDFSDKTLSRCDNDPQKALDELVGYFENRIHDRCQSYDRTAIRYFLIKQIIQCNVFPNKDA